MSRNWRFKTGRIPAPPYDHHHAVIAPDGTPVLYYWHFTAARLGNSTEFNLEAVEGDPPDADGFCGKWCTSTFDFGVRDVVRFLNGDPVPEWSLWSIETTPYILHRLWAIRDRWMKPEAIGL